MDSLYYVLNILFNFIFSFLLSVFILFLTSKFVLKKFDLKNGNLSMYGIFLGLKEVDIFSISILTVRYIFMFWCLGNTNIESVHLILIILAGVIYSVLNKRIFHLFFDTISCCLLYIALLSKNIFFDYLVNILFEWKVLAIFILLVIFIVLYSSYFFLKDVDYVVRNNKYIKRKYNNN